MKNKADPSPSNARRKSASGSRRARHSSAQTQSSLLQEPLFATQKSSPFARKTSLAAKPAKAGHKSRQLLLDSSFQVKREFGGALLGKSHAKTARPISTKQAMHLTLRSTLAKGSRSFLASRQRSRLIEAKVHQLAKGCQLKIYRYANVGNHLHLLIQAASKKGLICFLRSISGIIARIVLKTERGQARHHQSFKASSKKQSFWDQRPWTRIVAWVQDFQNVKKYVELNFQEALGFTPRQNQRLRKFSSA